jgi:hypothetical protein
MPAPNVTVTQNVQAVQTTLTSAGAPTGILQTGGQVFGQTLTVDQAAAVAPVTLTTASVAAAEANTQAIQAALNSQNVVTLSTSGTCFLNDTLLIDSNRRLHIEAGTVLRSAGSKRFSMLSTVNCAWFGSEMLGVALICASDGTASGVGSIRQATSPARLFYRAPGDAEGLAVDVSGATSGAARFELTSANGKKLYVAVVVASLAGASSASVRIGANSGAKPVTWSRTSNVTTVTETGHTRLPGEAVILFGTNLAANVYVETVVAGTSWTFTDSRSNSSGTGEAFGKVNITITGRGTLDYAMANGVAVRSVQDTNTVVMLGASHVRIEPILLLDGYKYGILGQCLTDFDFDVRGDAGNASSSTAIIQINGKARHGRIRAAGRSTDTAMALIGGDYATQTLLFPNDQGGLDFDDIEVWGSDGTDSNFEALRIAGSAGLWFRNIRCMNIRHNVRSGTDSIISVAVDSAIYLGTETNVEGLLVDGVFPSKAGTTNCPVVSLAAAGSSKSSGVVLRRLELAYPVDADGFAAVQIESGNWRDITVENCYQRNPTWQGHLVGAVNGVATTVDSLLIQNNHLRIDNALKNTTWRSSLFFCNNPNFTAERVVIDHGSVIDASAAGTKASASAISQGVCKVLALSNIKQTGALDLLHYFSSSTACNIQVNNITMDNTSFVIRLDFPPASVSVGNVLALTTITDVVRIGYSSATVRIRSNGGMPATPSSGFHVNIAAGTSNSPDVNGLDMVCNTAALFAATGNMVKSSATNRVVMYDGSAWTAIA